jgi:glycosyltransferase involved in cell wall biosynthesis
MNMASSVSVVIPAYNEVESLPLLVDGIVPVLEGLGGARWEVILVDDGSTDGTAELMRKLAAERRGLKAVLLRTNFGKSAALMAGFREAEGDIVITMDADLQDDPQEIPAFVAMIEEGYDLVSGWKRTRHDPMEKRLASRFFNRVVRRVSGVPLHDFNCGFKAYRAWCVRDLSLHGNQHRFIPAILSRRGARVGELPVRHHERKFGVSKYGIARYFHGAADLATLIMLTKFSQSPLYLFGIVAFPFIALGTLIGGYLVANHFIHLMDPTLGFALTTRPMLIVAVFLFLTGVLVFLIGLLAELVLRAPASEKSFWVGDVVASGDATAARAQRDGDRARGSPAPASGAAGGDDGGGAPAPNR